jgi:general secretion pathway protein G
MPSEIYFAGRRRRSCFEDALALADQDGRNQPKDRHTREARTASGLRQGENRRRRRSRGFTLVELLIVVAVFLTICAIAIPNLMAAMDLARIARAVSEIHTLENEITLYLTINGTLPDDLSQVGFGNYNDPWGKPYQYLNHSTMKGNGHARKDRFLVPLNSDYDLYSMGKDGQSVSPITAKSSQDDIIRASNGSYDGLASQF